MPGGRVRADNFCRFLRLKQLTQRHFLPFPRQIVPVPQNTHEICEFWLSDLDPI